jgi:hypothetical protein
MRFKTRQLERFAYRRFGSIKVTECEAHAGKLVQNHRWVARMHPVVIHACLVKLGRPLDIAIDEFDVRAPRQIQIPSIPSADHAPELRCIAQIFSGFVRPASASANCGAYLQQVDVTSRTLNPFGVGERKCSLDRLFCLCESRCPTVKPSNVRVQRDQRERITDALEDRNRSFGCIEYRCTAAHLNVSSQQTRCDDGIARLVNSIYEFCRPTVTFAVPIRRGPESAQAAYDTSAKQCIIVCAMVDCPIER